MFHSVTLFQLKKLANFKAIVLLYNLPLAWTCHREFPIDQQQLEIRPKGRRKRQRI